MTDRDRTTRRGRLGLPLLAIIGLALLAVPRVVLHDLGLLDGNPLLNALLVFVPPIVWIVVALVVRVPKPFLTILAIGVCYGILLAIAHQLLWDIAFAGDQPSLGGNLAGLDPAAQALILRSFGAVSSLVVGAGVGVIAGLVAWAIQALTRRARRAS